MSWLVEQYPVARTEEYCQAARAMEVIGCHEIDASVAVEIARYQAIDRGTRKEIAAVTWISNIIARRGPERPISFVQLPTDLAGLTSCKSEVRITFAIQIGYNEPRRLAWWRTS